MSDTVTGRISKIKQPYGGYIPWHDFDITRLPIKENLYANENISANLVGTAVDYMTRFLMGTPKEKAFEISLRGASGVKETKKADQLLAGIQGIDNTSVINACKLTVYDARYRSGKIYYAIDDIEPDDNTIKNIAIMVERCLSFWEQYGPITKEGFTFEGGYTDVIAAGDGDFLTKDALWDVKVTMREITSKHTLQLLVYYLMGKHSIHKEFETINRIGIFNPRSNKVYTLETQNIPDEVIENVSKDVIGYEGSEKNFHNNANVTSQN